MVIEKHRIPQLKKKKKINLKGDRKYSQAISVNAITHSELDIELMGRQNDEIGQGWLKRGHEFSKDNDASCYLSIEPRSRGRV